MAKLTRVTGKIFGETASTSNVPKEIGQFGSAKAGTYNATGDVSTIQSLSAWSNGWIDAVTPTQQFPSLPEMTGVHKVLSYQNAYMLQQGIPEWDSGTTYYTNGFCSKAGKIYISLSDENLNNDPASDTVNWEEFTAGSSRNIGEIVTSTIPLEDAGLHLLDGTLISGSGSYSAFVDYIADVYSIYGNVANGTNTLSNFLTNPSYAFDGDLSTEAMTGLSLTVENNAYIGQSGLTKPVKSLRIWQGASDIIDTYCTGFKLQYSNDGSTWNDIQSVSTTIHNQWQIISVSDYTPSGATHSFRIFATNFAGVQGTNNWRIFELELYTSSYQPIFTSESQWQTDVTNTGYCQKYVYDAVNNTVRLPKQGNQLIHKLPTTLGVCGDGTTLGMTDNNANGGTAMTTAGVNVHANVYGLPIGSSATGNTNMGILKSLGVVSDVSKSGLIAKTNTIVSSTVYYYVVVASTVKTDIQVDIDQIATDLNGKVDVDFSNADSVASSRSAWWAFPSNNIYENLTLGATGATYTASANGYISFAKFPTAAGQMIQIVNATSGLGVCAHSGNNATALRIFFPIKKGESYQVYYTAAGNIINFRFIYAVGCESEYTP